MGKCFKTEVAIVALLATVHAVTKPPGIFKQSPFDVFYKAGETVMLECEADGEPRPTYTWKVNGKDFNPSGNDVRVVQLFGKGTIVFSKPEDKDEGIYQCNATNEYGTSLSIKYNLREAKLKEFEQRDRRIVQAYLGRNLTLECVPPESIPMANVFWIIKNNFGGYEPVNYDDRVTMDIEYRLRFTNVKYSDLMGGRPYACMAMNGIMRKSTQGQEFQLQLAQGTEEMRTVSYLWASPEDHSGLRGEDFHVKCIFGGNPTPDVHWERTDGAPLPTRAQIRSFGMELLITDLQFEDAGTYECWGTNSITTKRVLRTITVRVHSKPFWAEEPKDVETTIGGTAEFTCVARSDPEPDYFWFINGIPYEQAILTDTRLSSNRFQHPRQERIIFTDLTRADSMVIQCNATNKHGYIWADVVLNVLSEAPTIIVPPDNRKIVAEGTTTNMTCRVTGKPDPIITWYKDDQQITGGRYRILPGGDLHFEHVGLSDAGMYRCEAENTFNKTSRTGLLLVRRKTQIETKPKDLEVTAGFNAKFTCSGTTDPEEVDKLQIKWLKDNKEISTVVQRMTTNIQDNSLTISGTIVRDSGTYTCIATNGLDSAEVSAMLTVRDRPEAPSKVVIRKCQNREAHIEWMPGSYNNAPVQYYIIQYNTTFNPDTWTFAQKVDSIYSTANISLSPWVNYTFRVIAYNKIGESEPSFPSLQVCTTKDAVPEYNPRNVRTIGDQYGQLHIEWTPIPPIEHNGDSFLYELLIWREGFDEQVTKETKQNWTIHEHRMDTGDTPHEPYYIQIRSQNTMGYADQDPVVIKGYTFEAIPAVTCSQPAMIDVGDTYATLQWEFDYTQINVTRSLLNGEFRGFKIQFWQDGNRRDTLRDWDLTPEKALASRMGNTFRATVNNLLPFTDMQITVAVMNNFFVSEPSDVLDFKTLPGYPGPVELLRPINIGDNHVNLEWKPPVELRGDILGFDIGYQTVNGLDLGEMQERDPQVNDPYATTAILSGLLTKTKYRVHMWARTAKGRGEDYFIELETTEAGDPQAPRFTITDVGQHHINISWWINPYASSGTVVFVEYRKEDAAEWLKTTDEVISSWKDLINLEAGTMYEIRVVATTGGVQRASSIEEVTTDGTALATALVGNYGWFLGMMLCLFLFIGVIIFFVIIYKKGKRFKTRGGSYSRTSSDYEDSTYSDTAQIPKKSRFEMKPKGFSNNQYEDGDDRWEPGDNKGGQRYDDDDEGGFKDRRYNDDRNDKDFDDKRQGYDDRYYGDEKDRGNYGDDRNTYGDDRDNYGRDNYDDERYGDERDNYGDHQYEDEPYYDDDRRQQRRYSDERRHPDDDYDINYPPQGRNERRRDDDRKTSVDDDDERYRRASSGRAREDSYPPTSEEPYEEYERKPSTYDPEYDDRDYREPSRFDRHGAPIDIRERSGTSKSKGAGAPSTFV